MSRVALAASRFALLEAQPSLEAHLDVDSPRLVEELTGHGVAATLEEWDDPMVDWESFELVVVRSTWGYARHYREFLAWAHARSRQVNSYDVLEYSSDKHYLGDLADQGFAVVETTYCEVGEEPSFPDEAYVVKPAVGAGSIDAQRDDPEEESLARSHVALTP